MKKHDIRFQVSENFFKRIKKQAQHYDETVAPFCRRVVIDRILALEVQDTNESLSEAIPLLKRIQEEGGLGEMAEDIGKMSSKMEANFSGDNEKRKSTT